MGFAVLDTLHNLEHTTAERRHITLDTYRLGKGDVVCSLKGANALENTLFSSLNRTFRPN